MISDGDAGLIDRMVSRVQLMVRSCELGSIIPVSQSPAMSAFYRTLLDHSFLTNSGVVIGVETEG